VYSPTDMNSQMVNRVLVLAGSLLAVNGLLLAATPRRFATLRSGPWVPDQGKQGLRWLAEHDQAGRALGAAGALAGLVLLLYGVAQAEPA
jgi:hypothetical protein